jgi:hypothetical protein
MNKITLGFDEDLNQSKEWWKRQGATGVMMMIILTTISQKNIQVAGMTVGVTAR